MTGLAYLASIFAVVWLSYWLLQSSRSQPKQSSKPNSGPQWTPFDYDTGDKADAKPAEQDQLKGWRSRSNDSRRRG